jgi:co-chaperonin GroES (HSP10)
MISINESYNIVAAPQYLVVQLNTDELQDKKDIWEASRSMDYIEKSGSAVMYSGTVKSVGSLFREKVETGDTVVFNSFSGVHLTTTNSLTKVIPGTDALIKIKKDTDMKQLNVNDLIPLGDRILIEVIEDNADIDNTDESNNKAQFVEVEGDDPRAETLTYGKVLKLGKECTGLVAVGDIVVIEHFVGEIVRPSGIGASEIRALSELYVTAIVKPKK